MTEYPHDPQLHAHGSAAGDDYKVDSEIHFRMLFAAGIVIAGLMIFACLVTAGLYHYFHQELIHQDPAPSPVAAANGIHLPPLPRIQPDPPADLARMRAHEDKILYHFGWVDKAEGTVHIPISDALKIYLQEHGTSQQSGTGQGAAAGSNSAQTPSQQPASGGGR